MFEIASGLFDLYHEGIDSLIENLGGRSPSTLIYPAIKTPCENCTQNYFGGSSTNVYKTGGPFPFSDGFCPLCGGKGFKESENSESVKLIVYWEPKNWVKLPGISFDVPDTTIQTKGYMKDLPKIERAIELRVSRTIEGFGTWRFKRKGEPVPAGFHNKYLIVNWTRIT